MVLLITITLWPNKILDAKTEQGTPINSTANACLFNSYIAVLMYVVILYVI